MARYEYRVMHMPAGSISVLNERLKDAAQENWHPILMSGNDLVNVILRRQVPEEQSQSQQQQS